jgi:hypothetical protein
MRDKGDYYEVMGNRRKDLISKSAFLEDKRVSLNGFGFRIMLYEWFSLYLGTHLDENKLEHHDQVIKERVLPYCRKFSLLSTEILERPSNVIKIPL